MEKTETPKSIFAEVKLTRMDKQGRTYCLDAYKTQDPDEEGRVLGEFNTETRRMTWREDTTARERTDPKVILALFDFTSKL